MAEIRYEIKSHYEPQSGDSPGFRRRRRSCTTHAYDRYATAFSIVSLMIHVGVTAPGVEEAVSNRECNEPRIVSKILIRQESLPDTDASAGVARVNVVSVLCQTWHS